MIWSGFFALGSQIVVFTAIHGMVYLALVAEDVSDFTAWLSGQATNRGYTARLSNEESR